MSDEPVYVTLTDKQRTVLSARIAMLMRPEIRVHQLQSDIREMAGELLECRRMYWDLLFKYIDRVRS